VLRYSITKTLVFFNEQKRAEDERHFYISLERCLPPTAKSSTPKGSSPPSLKHGLVAEGPANLHGQPPIAFFSGSSLAFQFFLL
jgi:hypothetical protein